MISNYYSGFSLKNEKSIFDDFIIENDFTISGFSYGAIKAFEYVSNTQKRIDLLQLFSPAFFQTQSEKFRRMQLIYFNKDSEEYCNNFLKNISFPSSIDMNEYFSMGTSQELEELLNYNWDEDKLKELVNKGTKIEVYLGEKDKIIDSMKAKDFFVEYATVYYIKNVGHILN